MHRHPESEVDRDETLVPADVDDVAGVPAVVQPGGGGGVGSLVEGARALRRPEDGSLVTLERTGGGAGRRGQRKRPPTVVRSTEVLLPSGEDVAVIALVISRDGWLVPALAVAGTDSSANIGPGCQRTAHCP